MEKMPEVIAAKLGYASDPAIEMLLPKELLAQIKIRKLEIAIQELEAIGELLNMQREMLAKEFKR